MNCILLTKISQQSVSDTQGNQQTVLSAVITNKLQITHINKVLRLAVGDTLKIGLLNDNLGTAKIQAISKEQIQLIDIVLDKAPPQKLNLTVILALPRPKVLRRLIMDMTALGVNKIVLLNSYRTEKSYWQSPMLSRIDEFISDGLQQSLDTIPPSVELKKRFKPFVEDEFSQYHQQAIIAHPYTNVNWQDYKKTNQLPQIICIGAEGGWIDYEVDLLTQHGCVAVNFGQRILRTETAVSSILGNWL